MRSYRDLWLWLGGLFLVLFPFPAAIAIAYYAKLTHYSVLLNLWMLASLLFFLAAFACFFCAIKGVRMPPWKKIEFPNIRVHVYGVGFTTVERVITVTGASDKLRTLEELQRFMVRITNLEAEQNASLTIRFYAKLVPGSFGPALNTVCPPPDWNIPQDLGLRPIEDEPLVLGPGVARGGDLLYVKQKYFNFVEPVEGYLEIEDHVSGKRMRIPAQGDRVYDKASMAPSTGGIEFAEEPSEPPPAEPPKELPCRELWLTRASLTGGSRVLGPTCPCASTV